MASYYVYSPLSGQIVSSDCYCYRYSNNCNPPDCTGTVYCKDAMACTSCGGAGCNPCGNCCKHVIVSSTSYKLPLDVNETGYINAYFGSNIASIKISPMTGMCATATGWINTGSVVEIFTGASATGKKLETILYGHVESPWYTQATVVNRAAGNPWMVVIGTVPSVPANQKCYQSMHSHLQVQAEAGVTVNRANNGCGVNVTRGTTALYWWVY